MFALSTFIESTSSTSAMDESELDRRDLSPRRSWAERERDSERDRRDWDTDRDRDMGRSRSKERERRRDDEDRHRSRSRSPRRRHHSRSASRERDRERSRDRRSRSRSRHAHEPRSDRDRSDRDRTDRDRDRERERRTSARGPDDRSVGGPMNAPAAEAEAHARVSRREHRLYVGNLAYDCNYRDLERFMSGAGGRVVFAEILITPTGQSKGCGIVEFESADQAQQAKAELADKHLLGRSVFIREDREETARFGAPPVAGKIGQTMGAGFGPGFRGGFRGGFAGGFGGGFAHQAIPNRNVFVGNVPMQASWQDLKDLMRQAGEVIRADVGMTPDGRPKGNGTVVFLDANSARNAIQMYNGFDWFGSILEVREDRFAHFGPGRGRGGFPVRGFPVRGAFGFRGGFMGRGGGFGVAGAGRGGFIGAPVAGVHGGFAAGLNGAAVQHDTGMAGMAIDAHGSGLAPIPAEPNTQILVRNLPFSTSHDDLVELFETVGAVVCAEMFMDGDQSRGEGVVEFVSTDEADLAAQRFMGYVYGGRPLDVQYNPKWHEFSERAVKGGQIAAEG
ncbi:g-strand binding protein [Cryptotrichosporon argae]